VRVSQSLLTHFLTLHSEPDSGIISKLDLKEQHVQPNGSAPFHQGVIQSPTQPAHNTLSVSDTSAIRSLQSFDSIDGQNSSTETDIQVEAPGSISQYEADPTSPVSKVFDISALSQAELMSVMTDTPTHSARIEEVAELLRTLIPLGECQLHPEECTKLLEILDKVCGGREPVYNHAPTVKPPIKFKDAVGRKFSFPWHLCKSWKVRRI
jgi:hypothetical protein